MGRYTGLDETILDRIHPRTSFFLQNKEGICSSIGLTALYLIYVQIGRHLLPLIEHGNILKRTVTLMIFIWTLVIIFNLFGVIASRRMANLGYVLWITAMTPSFLSFCIIGDNLRCEYAIKTPKLISDLNSTQLPVKSKDVTIENDLISQRRTEAYALMKTEMNSASDHEIFTWSVKIIKKGSQLRWRRYLYHSSEMFYREM